MQGPQVPAEPVQRVQQRVGIKAARAGMMRHAPSIGSRQRRLTVLRIRPGAVPVSQSSHQPQRAAEQDPSADFWTL